MTETHTRNLTRRKLSALWAGAHGRAKGKAAEVEQQHRKILTWADQAKLKELFENVSGPVVEVMDPGKAGQGH